MKTQAKPGGKVINVLLPIHTSPIVYIICTKPKKAKRSSK